LILALVLCAVGASARADDVADFYKDKPITVVVAGSAGGGYDTLARTLARFLGKHVPGDPIVTVRNVSGTTAAANALFNTAAKDGSVIGLIQNNTPFGPILGARDTRFEPMRFNWLGSPSGDTAMLAVGHEVPANSLADLRQRETMVGSAGANSTPAFYARLINDVFGTRLKVVGGYPGQTEALMAMERGELDGDAGILLGALLVTRADWLTDRKIKPLLYYGPQKRPELDGVPFARDLVTGDDDRALLDAAFAPLALGRPLVTPPGVPAERLAALRKALAETFTDPQFRSESKRLGLDADAPRSGEEIADVIRRTYVTAPHVLDRWRKLDKVPR
jgi:tripartite-type tricarboxylate transporter receptor subunit TctC